MLVNLTPNEAEIERRRKIAKEHPEIFNSTWLPQNDPLYLHSTGVYWASCKFNFPYEEFEEFSGRPTFEQKYDALDQKCQYGVADNVDQVLEHYSKEIKDPDRKFFIDLSPVYQNKDNAGKGGGWRWHKWGPYIGELKPMHEYLDDEDFGPDFECVICFHITEVL